MLLTSQSKFQPFLCALSRRRQRTTCFPSSAARMAQHRNHSSITVGAANGVFMAMGSTFAPISPVNGFAQNIGQRIRPETCAPPIDRDAPARESGTTYCLSPCQSATLTLTGCNNLAEEWRALLCFRETLQRCPEVCHTPEHSGSHLCCHGHDTG